MNVTYLPDNTVSIERDSWRAMHVPVRYEDCTRETWEVKGFDPWPGLDSWLEDPGKQTTVLLLGPTGCGKTHLATALLYQYTEKVGHGWWLDAVETMEQYRDETMDRLPDRTVPPSEKLRRKHLVLIDEFRFDRLTDFERHKWVYFLCYRYNHMLPTIITSNAERIEQFDALDPRITSRLYDGIIIRLKGKDRRQA